MDNIHITFIGCGNMGRSLIGGLIAGGYPPNLLCGSDINAEQRKLISTQFNIEIKDNNKQAIKAADVVVLTVKPQAMKDVLTSINTELTQRRLLIISVAAGIRLTDLLIWTHEKQAIVRAMPNTPALIQTSATALSANNFVGDEQHNIAEAIMRAVGLTIWLDDEALMDTVTALSGSGPAYYFLVMEAMEKAATKLGLSAEQARLLTLQTAFGAAKMALESEHDPATLRKHVTSPGGTTESAINVFLNGGFEHLFKEAMSAAMERSKEIAESMGNK